MVLESLSRRLSRVFKLAILLRRGFIQRSRFRREFDIDRFAVGLVGKFEVRAMALGGVGGTGAPGFAALHHSLQNRTFAEILDLLQTPSEFQEALRVAFQGGIPYNGTDSTFRNRNT
jgi:hypothetical protein